MQVGADILVLLGGSLESLKFEIRQLLENRLGERIMLESLKERIAGGPTPLFRKNLSEINREISDIGYVLDHINKHISDTNKNVLGKLGISRRIRLLDKKIIKNFIKERLKNFPNNEKTIRVYNENLKLKISNEFRIILRSIDDIKDYLEENEKFEEKKNLCKKFKVDINEAISIYSIGYGKTAVLCVGRTIEKAIDDYLKILYIIEKIPRKKYIELINGKEDKEPKYSIKIGFLNGNRSLNDEEFTKLKAYSFDRNKGGHPNLGEIDNQRAKTLISQGIWLIMDLQNKMDRLKNSKYKKKIMGKHY